MKKNQLSFYMADITRAQIQYYKARSDRNSQVLLGDTFKKLKAMSTMTKLLILIGHAWTNSI